MPLHQQIPPTHVHRLPVPPTSNNTASGSRLENLFYIIKNLKIHKKINTASLSISSVIPKFLKLWH